MIPIKNLEVGRFFEVKEGHEIHLFRLLRKEPSILVASYWPIFDEAEKAELKSNCTELPFTENTPVLSGAYNAITDEDLEAIAAFERIREAKAERMHAYTHLITLAQKHLEDKQWESAIAALNEAAPYNKLDGNIYKLRGLCQLYSGNTLLAKADLGFYLETTDDPEIRQIWKSL